MVVIKTNLYAGPGTYDAKVQSIVEITTQYGPSLKWTFELIDPVYPDFIGSTLSGMTSNKATPQSKLTHWLNDGFGVVVEDDFDTDSLIGLSVKVKAETKGDFTNVVALRKISPQQTPTKPVSNIATKPLSKNPNAASKPLSQNTDDDF